MTHYTNMTREQLVELLNLRDDKIKQLENEILEIKRGYIYIVQFENDIKKHIFKCGKSVNPKNRFGVYRTKISPILGCMKVIRLIAVKDCLAAEQFMHNLIRQNCKCANRSIKSEDKSEWYIDENMLNIEAAFDETKDKYGMNDDEIVQQYDSIAKDELQDDLVEITHHYDIILLPKTYYIHKSTHTIYVKQKHVLTQRKETKSKVYSLQSDTHTSCRVKLDYLINEYCK